PAGNVPDPPSQGRQDLRKPWQLLRKGHRAFRNCRWPSGCPRKTFIVYTRIALVKPLFSGKAQRWFERVAPMSPEAEGWRRAGRPDGGFSLQPSLRGFDGEATRCSWSGWCRGVRSGEAEGV